jgi:hypothetical protein
MAPEGETWADALPRWPAKVPFASPVRVSAVLMSESEYKGGCQARMQGSVNWSLRERNV